MSQSICKKAQVERLAVSRERGSVLVVTLMVVLLLAAIVMAFSDETGIELSICGYSRDGEQAYQTARSGIQAALAVINGDQSREVDTLKEEWHRVETGSLSKEFMEGSTLAVRIEDESGKLNLNTLVENEGGIQEIRERQAKRLFSVLGLHEEELDPLLDWLDHDSIERIHGAESEYYRNLEYPYPCANGTLQTLDQLSMVKGFGGLRTEGGRVVDLSPFVTLYTDGKININTASAEVLQCMSEQLDGSMAQAIVTFRKTEEFQSVNDLMKVPGFREEFLSGVSPFLTVKSSAMSVESIGSYREAVCTVRAVVVRNSDKEPTDIIYWKVE